MSPSLSPRSLERPADAGATLVGVLDANNPFAVDGGGLVQAPGQSWTLDWWIGADDRWYFPSREASVRQSRRGFGPVIETSMRVPSGDVTQTVYAVHSGATTGVGDESVCVVEISNQSPVPVALALAVRPYGHDGLVDGADPLSVRWLNEHTMGIGSWQVTLPRAPREKAFSAEDDLATAVGDGATLAWPTIDGDSDATVASTLSGSFPNGVVLFPLPHGTSIRCAVSATGSTLAVADLAGPDNVARGWDSIVSQGGRFEFPDSGLTDLAGASRARLAFGAGDLVDDIASALQPSPATRPSLLARLRGATEQPPPSAEDRPAASPSAVLAAKAQAGLHDNLAADLEAVVQLLTTANFARCSDEELGSLAHAASMAAVAVGDPGQAFDLLEPVAAVAKRLERRSSVTDADGAWAKAARGLLALARATGQDETAAILRDRLDQYRQPEPVDHAALTAMAQAARGGGRWPSVGHDGQPIDDSVAAAAQFWLAARGRLLNEQLLADSPTIELLPDFPAAWRGGGVEVHGAATLFGSVSFAIRWHGARPALLWDQADGNARLLCPSLDPDWSTNESKGETLLAGDSEGLVQAPGPGDSFS